MHKINDFSNATGVSKETLRYYDKINFFKRSYVDYFTDYRYYDENQIGEIIKINKLKELGLSLEEIKQYLNGNNNVLIKKRKKMEEIMSKFDELLEKHDRPSYVIEKSNYTKYLEMNGLKMVKCPQALEIRDENAYYFIINNNDKFLNDFCIYKENNWLTLDDKYLVNDDLMKMIFAALKKYMKNIILYIPEENKKLVDF